MLSFKEYITLNEQIPGPPPGGPDGGLGGPPGGLGGGPPLPPPPGGLGGPLGGGLGGPPMGGMGMPMGGPGMAQGGPAQTKEVKPLDVWRIIERILEGKPANLKKPGGQGSGNQVNSPPTDLQPPQPSPTGFPPSPPGPPGGMAGPAQPQHLLGAPK